MKAKLSIPHCNFFISALVHTLLIGCALIFFPNYSLFPTKENITIQLTTVPTPPPVPAIPDNTTPPQDDKPQLPKLKNPQRSTEFIPSAPSVSIPSIPLSNENRPSRPTFPDTSSQWLNHQAQTTSLQEIASLEPLDSELFLPEELPPTATTQKLPTKWHHQLYSLLVYPTFARRNNWEGNVTLTIITAEDGKLGAYHIKKSSGYELLDSCSIKALKKLFPIPELSPYTTYELTICFRLK